MSASSRWGASSPDPDIHFARPRRPSPRSSCFGARTTGRATTTEPSGPHRRRSRRTRRAVRQRPGQAAQGADHRQSGPIVIGQAAEFDYAGTQACKAMREEGVTSVLVNSNPATIMTDEGVADTVYIEPLTVEVLERIIEARAAGRASAYARRPDRPQPRGRACRGGRARALRRASARARRSSPSASPRTARVPHAAARESASLTPESVIVEVVGVRWSEASRTHRPPRSSFAPPTRSAAPAAASRTTDGGVRANRARRARR